MLSPFWLAAALGAAQEPSSATLRLALIEDVPPLVATKLEWSVERLAKERPAEFVLTDVEDSSCEVSSGQFRFRWSELAGAKTALRMDAGSETALMVPEDQELAGLILQSAADPGTYRRPWTVRFSTSSVALKPDGALVSTLAEEGAGRAWSRTHATRYRIRWKGRDSSLIVVGRWFGGLGRLHAAMDRERAGGPVLGVSRGGVLRGSQRELKGLELIAALEGMGLRYASVVGTDIRHWKLYQPYRDKHPGGIQFLSANLVYSSAPAVSYLPDHALVSIDGLRVVIAAVTPPSARKYLAQAGLGHLEIAPPLQAVSERVARWREAGDVVVLIAQNPGDHGLDAAPGIDLVLAHDREVEEYSLTAPESRSVQTSRRAFEPPLVTVTAAEGFLNLVELTLRRGLQTEWSACERHVALDDTLPPVPGYPGWDPAVHTVEASTAPPLLPAGRRIFLGDPRRAGRLRLSSREFWTIAASMLAEETRAEAAFLPVHALPVQIEGDTPESLAKLWLHAEDQVVILRIAGSELKDLLRQAHAQARREEEGRPHGGRIRMTVGGVGAGERVHGLPVVDNEVYRVAASRVFADGMGVRGEEPLAFTGTTVEATVLEALRRRTGTAPAIYRSWAEGRPVRERGLWRLHVRELGLNIKNSRVVRDDAFASVPNSRIQGFDELVVGGDLRTDLEYLRPAYRWKSTAELEYARSRIQRRGQQPVITISANRVLLATLGTLRAGRMGPDWLARSWGPSLGLQFDGQVEAVPGLRRKEVYSAFPGVEFFDGSVVRSIELSGSLRRDLSRDPPNTQYGARTKVIAERSVGPRQGATLQGELTAGYSFLSDSDRPQDLRFEGGLILRLRVPFYKHLTVSPFLDLYAFSLKVKPVWGYSAVTGITIGFSRLWKPQYEGF